MTEIEIAKAINPEFPDVYATTFGPTTLYFKNNTIKVGYFQFTEQSENLKKNNIFTFIEFKNAAEYEKTKNENLITKVSGDDLLEVIYNKQ